MGLEIIPIGGYSEVGRNSILIKVDDEAVILDLGLHMDNYIRYNSDTDRDDYGDKSKMSAESLIQANAVPNIYQVEKLWPKVKAIVIGHAHLDHIGAVPFLASKFKNAEIHGTKFSMEVLKEMLKSDGVKLRNRINAHKPNAKVKISKKITLELLNMTHSIPQTATTAIHTPYGTIVYAVDFKLDNAPVLGDKPNYKRLEQLGKKGVKVLIMDCLYAHMQSKTPSESIAKEMLKDVMLGVHSKGNSIVVTTFASHIARLQTIIDLSRKMKRKVYLIGRSFDKYVTAAKKAGVVDLTKKAEMIKYGSTIQRFFKKIKHPEKCVFVVTGHQAEPGSVLPRMVFKNIYPFKDQDNVIFSCSVIPVPQNIANRERLDEELRRRKLRIFTDVHVSGHAYREDHREMLRMLKPETLVPMHAPKEKLKFAKELAIEMGMKPNQVKMLKNNERIKV